MNFLRAAANKRAQFIPIIPLFIIIVFVTLACIKLRWPAVHYDEAFYVNSATHVDATTFRTMSLGPIPIIIMPYIGALKAYVYGPVFAVFGAHAVTMRLPSILITAGALYLLFGLLRKRLGALLATSILLITAWSASFIIFTRLDFGPVVLDFLLKMVALLLLLRFVEKPDTKTLGWFWAVLFLGVFNKLNFIWYLSAFVLGAAVVWGKPLWSKISRPDKKRMLQISAIGFALSAGYSLFIKVHYHLPQSFGLVPWSIVSHNLEGMAAGSWFYNYAFSASPLGVRNTAWLMAWIISMGGLLLWTDRRMLQGERWRNIRQLFTFFTVITVLLLAQLAITKQATAGWHYFALYPFTGALFVLALYIIFMRLAGRRRELAGWLFAAVILGLGLQQLHLYRTYITVLDKPTANITWSPATYRLVDFAKAHPRAQFVSLDWGTHVPLLILDPVHNKYFEQMGPLHTEDPVVNKYLYETYLVGKPNAYYVAYIDDATGFPSTKAQFIDFAHLRGYKVTSTTQITDGHQPIIELYTFGKQ